MIVIDNERMRICQLWGSPYCPPRNNARLGIGRNIRDRISPINGLRHLPSGDLCGWYIWTGETLPQDEGFFDSLHARYIPDWRPEVDKYLGLAPGWRFLIAPDYEDVWFDENLLVE